jgi:anaerobic selenocysteine-containing dehydrogenase
MHVLFAENLKDDDFIARHTLGAEQLCTRAAEWTPERASATTGIPVETIVTLARRYGRARNGFIRVNYGLQRHAGGGMAVRTIACLPAITGHWRHAGGGVQLSTSKNFSFNVTKLHRADAGPPTRIINMIRLGDALTLPDAGVGGPPVKALVVYNSNPGAVAPERGGAGLCARRPVHRGAGALSDRHRRLRRLHPARHHATGALGRAQAYGHTTHAQPARDCSDRRGAA